MGSNYYLFIHMFSLSMWMSWWLFVSWHKKINISMGKGKILFCILIRILKLRRQMRNEFLICWLSFKMRMRLQIRIFLSLIETLILFIWEATITFSFTWSAWTCSAWPCEWVGDCLFPEIKKSTSLWERENSLLHSHSHFEATQANEK